MLTHRGEEGGVVVKGKIELTVAGVTRGASRTGGAVLLFEPPAAFGSRMSAANTCVRCQLPAHPPGTKS